MEEVHDTHDDQVEEPTLPPAPPPLPPSTALTTMDRTALYGPCQKNHAAHLGQQSVDGCLEFLPSGEEGTPDALKCACCGCHRNFHRKVEMDPNVPNAFNLSVPPAPVPVWTGGSPGNGPVYTLLGQQQRGGQLVNYVAVPSGMGGSKLQRRLHSGPRRKRTAFTPDQKEKMQEFADSIDWTIVKRDRKVVDAFCESIGIERSNLIHYMHNKKKDANKKAMLEQEQHMLHHG